MTRNLTADYVNAMLNAYGIGDGGTARKGEGPLLTSDGAGQYMNNRQTQALVDLTRENGGWLAGIDTRIVGQRKGEVPLQDLSGPVVEHVGGTDTGENQYGEGMVGLNQPTKPDLTNLEYDCRKSGASFMLSLESIREAARSGTPDAENAFRMSIGKAVGNNLAQIGTQGDTTLDRTTKTNRMLRASDGYLKLTNGIAQQDEPTTSPVGIGRAFDGDVFWRMLDLMDPDYVHDPDLMFWVAPAIDIAYTMSLRNAVASGGSQGSAQGDRASNSRGGMTPAGIEFINNRYQPSDGAGTIGAKTPTAVADSSGYLTVTLTTLLGSTNYAGRKVKVTCLSTGQSEVCTVYNDGANKCDTSGYLGQLGTPSTTASAYSVQTADQTSILLFNPKNLTMFMVGEMRAWRQWIPALESWIVYLFFELCFKFKNLGAVARMDGVVRPSIGSNWS